MFTGITGRFCLVKRLIIFSGKVKEVYLLTSFLDAAALCNGVNHT